MIVSVVENFICDDVREVDLSDASANALEIAVKASVDKFVARILQVAEDMPSTRFAIAHTLLRPLHTWYTANYDRIGEHYRDSILAAGRDNVTVLDKLSGIIQEFEPDGVHLTEISAANCIECLIENADAFFEAEMMRTHTEPGMEPNPWNSREGRWG